MNDPETKIYIMNDKNKVDVLSRKTQMTTSAVPLTMPSRSPSIAIAGYDYKVPKVRETRGDFMNEKQHRRQNRHRCDSNKRALFLLATTAAAAATLCLSSTSSLNIFVESFSFNPFRRSLGWRGKSSTRSGGRIVSSAFSSSAEEDIEDMNKSLQNSIKKNINYDSNSNGKGKKNSTPSLDDWKIESDGRITGRSMNHPLVPDGEIVTTACLDPSCLEGGVTAGDVISTVKGTKYELLKTPPVGSSYFPSPSKDQVFNEDVFSYTTTLPYDQQLAFLEELTESIKKIQGATAGTSTSSSTDASAVTPAVATSPAASTVAPVVATSAAASTVPLVVATSVAASSIAPLVATSTSSASTSDLPRAQKSNEDLSAEVDGSNGEKQQQPEQPTQDETQMRREISEEPPKRPTYSIGNIEQQQEQNQSKEKSSLTSNIRDKGNNALGGVATLTAATTAAAAVTLGVQAGLGTEVLDGAKQQLDAQVPPQAKELIASVNSQVQKQSKVVLPYLEEQIRIAEAKLEEAQLEEKAKNTWNEVANYLSEQETTKRGTRATTTVASTEFNEAISTQNSLKQVISNEAMAAVTIPGANSVASNSISEATTAAKSVADIGTATAAIGESAVTATIATASVPQLLAEEQTAQKAEQAKAIEKAEAKAEALRVQEAEKAEALRLQEAEKAEALRVQEAEKAAAEAKAEALRVQEAEKAEAEAKAEALRVQ